MCCPLLPRDASRSAAVRPSSAPAVKIRGRTARPACPEQRRRGLVERAVRPYLRPAPIITAMPVAGKRNPGAPWVSPRPQPVSAATRAALSIYPRSREAIAPSAVEAHGITPRAREPSSRGVERAGRGTPGVSRTLLPDEGWPVALHRPSTSRTPLSSARRLAHVHPGGAARLHSGSAWELVAAMVGCYPVSAADGPARQ